MSDATAIGRSQVKHWFYISVGLFVILLGVAGFAPSLIDECARKVPLPLSRQVLAFLSSHVVRHEVWART